MPPLPGTHLGPYEITGPLGSGGMGEVYRARDTRLERTVAIKILPRELSNDPIRRQRFEREAKTISSLNHPSICVLHDVGSQDGIDYLVMECVEGETLSKRLERGSLPLDQVLKVGREIADALDKAQRSGVVHRDLKPGNIMLTVFSYDVSGDGQRFLINTKVDEANAAPLIRPSQLGFGIGEVKLFVPQRTSSCLRQSSDPPVKRVFMKVFGGAR
jgi:serine/threonine protein kinase